MPTDERATQQEQRGAGTHFVRCPCCETPIAVEAVRVVLNVRSVRREEFDAARAAVYPRAPQSTGGAE